MVIAINGQSPTFTLLWACRVSMRRKLAELRRTARDPRSLRTADSFRTSTGSFALFCFSLFLRVEFLLFYLKDAGVLIDKILLIPRELSVFFSLLSRDELSLQLKHSVLYDLHISRLYGQDIFNGRKDERVI